jgi:glycosyltransferase involved in cell wall biosynthesis
MTHSSVLSVIIAARNEAAYIDRCLASLAGSENIPEVSVEIIVAANACSDDTVQRARAHGKVFAAREWKLTILDLAEGGKVNAVSVAEEVASGQFLVYLDADVTCDPPLLRQLAASLAVPEPRYATGTISVCRADSAITRGYARIWIRLPFVQAGSVGAGLFAMNRAGRARWGKWPDIISDDTFARLHFTASERIEVPANYHWPMVEGLANLIRVRRRQNAGVTEVADLYPELLKNDSKDPVTPSLLLRLAASDPAGLAIYLIVHLAVRLRSSTTGWTRGR